MAKINFRDSSWSETCFSSMYNWWYPAVPGYSDNVLQCEIITTLELATNEVNKLPRVTSDNRRLVDEWRRKLNAYKRTISRDEAGEVFRDLKQILSDAKDLVITSRSAGRSDVAMATQSSSGPSPGGTSTGGGMSNDDFAQHYSKHSARQRRTVAAPSGPGIVVDATYHWNAKQRRMLEQCLNTTIDLSHGVTQPAVLTKLGLRPGVQITQYQSTGATLPDLRIMKTGNATYWTRGLTHQASRDPGNFNVYKLDESGVTFSHISGEKLREHLAVL